MAGGHAGELCLSPVGLALVTRIAPATMAAMLMGVWPIELRGHLLVGYLAGMLESEERGAVFHFLGGHRSRPERCCSGSWAGRAI